MSQLHLTKFVNLFNIRFTAIGLPKFGAKLITVTANTALFVIEDLFSGFSLAILSEHGS